MSPSVAATCTLDSADATKALPLIVGLCVRLLVMYIVPCMLMIYFNVATASRVTKKLKWKSGMGHRNVSVKKKNKVKTNFGLLILSSVMMVVFMIKPTYDLHMAIRDAYEAAGS